MNNIRNIAYSQCMVINWTKALFFFSPRLEETPTSLLRPAWRFPFRLANNSSCPERVLVQRHGTGTVRFTRACRRVQVWPNAVVRSRKSSTRRVFRTQTQNCTRRTLRRQQRSRCRSGRDFVYSYQLLHYLGIAR